MRLIILKPAVSLRGEITVPGDKSISHRAAILSALAKGKTEISNFLFSDDCLITLRVLVSLGVKIELDKKKNRVVIVSKGCFKQPKADLFMGESGTSARVLLGLLCAQAFKSRLNAEPSLLRRPMARVITPLRLMGADINARKKNEDEFLPVEVSPTKLKGINWQQKVSSAQVKSAILFAGLYAEGRTVVTEPVVSRDHTERMLKFFKANINICKNRTTVERSNLSTPGKIFIPGDISSAAFFIVAGLLVKNSEILIKDAGINPTRIGIINVLIRMGANIKILNKKNIYEPMADIKVSSSNLQATTIRAGEIPSLIDELPVLMVAASLAKGKTVIEGAQELRVKESDRISAMFFNLKKLGVDVRIKTLNKDEVIEIQGNEVLRGASLRSFGDHRIAMSMCVVASVAEKPCKLDDITCVSKSFPEFWHIFKHLFN